MIDSYRGAQIFEAIGLGSAMIDNYFAGTPSKIEGVDLVDIARESLTRHRRAYAQAVPGEGATELEDPGFYRFRRQGEQHAVTPPVIKNFHTFVKSNKPEDYKAYADAIKAIRPNAVRELLQIVPTGKPSLPIDEVEPIEEIRRSFTTAGMSLGALRPVAHGCLADPLKGIGGQTKLREGGENPERVHRRPHPGLP